MLIGLLVTMVNSALGKKLLPSHCVDSMWGLAWRRILLLLIHWPGVRYTT